MRISADRVRDARRDSEKMKTEHNMMRDRFVAEYDILPPLTCRLCKSKVELPSCHEVVSEYRTAIGGTRFVADVAALDESGELIAVIEVINSNPPRSEVLRAQRQLPVAFYVLLNALDDKNFSGWCSADCWGWQITPEFHGIASGRGRMVDRNVPTVSWLQRCGDWSPKMDIWPSELGQPVGCGKLLLGCEALRDWSDDPYTGFCLQCAASIGIAQWNDPSSIAFGAAGILPPIPGEPATIFRSWSFAAFWHMVWNDRTATVPDRYGEEVDTAKRLDEVEAAFDRSDWPEGAELLQPIGNRWLNDYEKPLWAWNPYNCQRVARAWNRLREYLLKALPPEIAEVIPPPPEPPPLRTSISTVLEVASSASRISGWSVHCLRY